MGERIFLVERTGLAGAARQVVAGLPGAPELVALDDGAKCVGAFTKLAKAGHPPVLVVLDEDLPRVSGRSTALAVRALERAFDLKPTALLLYTEEPADDELKAFLAGLTRAVHLRRRAELPPEEQAKRLGKAVDRLLKQLRGNS